MSWLTARSCSGLSVAVVGAGVNPSPGRQVQDASVNCCSLMQWRQDTWCSRCNNTLKQVQVFPKRSHSLTGVKNYRALDLTPHQGAIKSCLFLFFESNIWGASLTPARSVWQCWLRRVQKTFRKEGNWQCFVQPLSCATIRGVGGGITVKLNLSYFRSICNNWYLTAVLRQSALILSDRSNCTAVVIQAQGN